MLEQLSKKLILAGAISSVLGFSASAQAFTAYNPDPSDGAGALNPGAWKFENAPFPFYPGYTGKLPAQWYAYLANTPSTSVFESITSAKAGFILGMGAKSYKDGSTNWGHSADMGIFQLSADAVVTISVTSSSDSLRPAFGLWKGWDTSNESSRHQAWLNNGAFSQAMSAGVLDSDLQLVDSNAWVVATSQGNNVTATLTKTLAAGKYTLILGGYDSAVALGVNGSNLPYSALISTTPVPLPAGAWLLGSGLIGLFGFSCNRSRV